MYDIINYRNLDKQLTELLASARYDEMNPINLFDATADDINERKDKAIKIYQNDSITYVRINTLVRMILRIIDQNVDKEA